VLLIKIREIKTFVKVCNTNIFFIINWNRFRFIYCLRKLLAPSCYHSQKSWVILLMNHYIFYLHIFISWKKKGGGGSALSIFSIFYTHHRISNEHMMTINFDTNTNNYEVIYFFRKKPYHVWRQQINVEPYLEDADENS
jgi:hypothetical protein